QRETDVVSFRGRRFDLREHVLAIERHDRLAGTSFHILADFQTDLEYFIVDWLQPGFRAGEHLFDITFGRSEIGVRIIDVTAFTFGAFREPPRRVGAESMFSL